MSRRRRIALLATTLGLSPFLSPGAAMPTTQETLIAVEEVGPLGSGPIGQLGESPDGRFILYPGGRSPAELRVFDRAVGTWTAAGRADQDYAWAPGGTRIAFARFDESRGSLQVWSMPFDTVGGRPVPPARRVTLGQGRNPSFSPDGSSIAFTAMPSTDTVAPRIVLVPATGGVERPLLSAPGWSYGFHWTADGRHLYHAFSPDDRTIVSRLDVESGRNEELVEVLDFYGMSRDGRFLAHAPAGEGRRPPLVIAGPDGFELARFTVPDGFYPNAWGAVGTRILGVRSPRYEAVQVVDLTDGSVRRLTPPGADNLYPWWSPDGDEIAYLEHGDAGWRLLTVAADGSRRRLFPTAAPPDPIHPRWSPDGRYLSYRSGGATSIHVLDRESGITRQVGEADLIPSAELWVDERALLYVARPTPDAAFEVRRVTVGGLETRLRAIPDSMGRPLHLVDAETLLGFTSAAVWIGSVGGDDARRFLTLGPGEVIPIWVAWPSADGRWIAVSVWVPDPVTTYRPEIRLVSRDGAAVRNLPLDGMPTAFRWHPDGQHLLARIGGAFWIVPVDGTPPYQVPLAEDDTPGSRFTLSPDGRYVVSQVVEYGEATLWEIDLTRLLAPHAGAAGPGGR